MMHVMDQDESRLRSVMVEYFVRLHCVCSRRRELWSLPRLMESQEQQTINNTSSVALRNNDSDNENSLLIALIV